MVLTFLLMFLGDPIGLSWQKNEGSRISIRTILLIRGELTEQQAKPHCCT